MPAEESRSLQWFWWRPSTTTGLPGDEEDLAFFGTAIVSFPSIVELCVWLLNQSAVSGSWPIVAKTTFAVGVALVVCIYGTLLLFSALLSLRVSVWGDPNAE